MLWLTVFNELVLVAVGGLIDRRVPRALRLHALMVGCAVLVAASGAIADFAAHPAWRTLPPLVHALASPLLSAASQCGLWAETFLVTGILLDALLRKRPTWVSCVTHARGGLARGALYAGLFVALVQIIRGLLAIPAFAETVRAHPAIAGVLLGAGAFPLAKTVVESFDGSSPFLPRLHAAYRDPLNALRGTLAGVGIGLAFAVDLPAHASGPRFLAGAAIGALAYAGADALWNLGEIAAGRRGRLQTWRVYALGATLGGFVGGALAWYLDTFQLTAVLAKFQAYAALDYGAVQRPVQPYVDYPLFSKYGAIDLGLVGGGVKQLYVESLSGVINWSLAAPLFGINLIALTALFERSWKPLIGLASADGAAKLVEQTVRVLRWGLWMAPIIYTFLRLAPDPTWYNQDGLVRTLVAIVQSASLSSTDFRAWSLSVFLGLLAYDALRVLIWFDHMGLRVATLVNLSFVGGDALDEKAARFAGHAGRTRVIPEGIRRFLTWAPLLIPFYIPRGPEWDQVWGQADSVDTPGTPLLPAVATLLVGYRIAAGLVAVAAIAVGVSAWRRHRGRPHTIARPKPFLIGNGQYALEMDVDGRGYSRCTSDVRPSFVLDLTRRPDDALAVRGKFVLLREVDAHGRAIGAPWSLTADPLRDGHAQPVRLETPTRLALAASRDG
ncbi:MAG TPA: hypothetical protein VJM11_16250, partial [Nevskiaceae bacterium]|nr:hypothetical protein [Nevskiaceae bacterium]